VKCLLCGSKRNKFKFVYMGRDIYLEKLGRNDFRLRWYECGNCGVYFSEQYGKIEGVYDDNDMYDAQYDREGIKARYHEIMGLNEDESDNALRVRRVKAFFLRYRAETGRIRERYQILDVGAGLGVFVAKIADDMFSPDALEMNSVATNHIREELGFPVFNIPVQEFEAEKAYDLITMNKVIEHIKKPVPVLKSIKRILGKDGIIYLELPDTRSCEFHGHASGAFASGHYMVYNPASIFYLLGKAGFEILSMDRIQEPSGKLSIYSFAGVRCS